jgi:hypothetical protein
MLALPQSGRRAPSPPRTLLLGLRSYRLDVFRPLGGSYPSVIAPTDSCADPSGSPLLRLLTSFEESVQVTTNPCYPWDLPDVILRIFLQMPEPLPRRFAECVCLVLPQHSSAFPRDKSGRRPAVPREHDFPRIRFRGCSYFFMFRPPRLLAPQIVPTAANCRAAEAFTSEQNVRRCLRTHRIYYPPDYRQLAERGLSPR